jgi:SAM-dependent methyltransferase
MMDPAMTSYYAKRAAEYERIYMKPERQADLKALQAMIEEACAGLDLLEIACGTGYWTQFAGRSAASIVATDVNEEVLSIAREKDYAGCPVTFLKSNAYVLNKVIGSFSGALVCFWWSHVPASGLDGFLQTLHSKLSPGARVLLLDNRYVKGSSSPISRSDAQGNTFQVRSLSDGSTYEVLKNFPAQNEVVERLAPFSKRCRFTELDYFWLADYILEENS